LERGASEFVVSQVDLERIILQKLVVVSDNGAFDLVALFGPVKLVVEVFLALDLAGVRGHEGVVVGAFLFEVLEHGLEVVDLGVVAAEGLEELLVGVGDGVAGGGAVFVGIEDGVGERLRFGVVGEVHLAESVEFVGHLNLNSNGVLGFWGAIRN